MPFVGGGDEEHFVVGLSEVREIFGLSLNPGLLLFASLRERVGERLDDPEHIGSEIGFNRFGIFDAAVFEHVVQERRDELVFRAAPDENLRGNSHWVRDVGN